MAWKSSWEIEILTFLTPALAAALAASPCKETCGAPLTSRVISISIKLAPAPLDSTPKALKTASLADQVPVNEACGLEVLVQYSTSPAVKFLSIKVSFSS